MKKLIADILIGWALSLDPDSKIKTDLDKANKTIAELYKAIGTDDYRELQHIKCVYNLNVEAERALFFGDVARNDKEWIEANNGLASEIEYFDDALPPDNTDKIN
jgi:hypothetical protein